MKISIVRLNYIADKTAEKKPDDINTYWKRLFLKVIVPSNFNNLIIKASISQVFFSFLIVILCNFACFLF
jgi:hypothetical protein